MLLSAMSSTVGVTRAMYTWSPSIHAWIDSGDVAPDNHTATVRQSIREREFLRCDGKSRGTCCEPDEMAMGAFNEMIA